MAGPKCLSCDKRIQPIVDRGHLAGDSTRVIVAQVRKAFPDCKLSQAGVSRHIRAGHVSAKLAKAAELSTVAAAGSVLSQALSRLEDVRSRVLALLDELDELSEAKRPRARLECMKELRQQIRLEAEITGELQTAQTIVNNTSNTINMMSPDVVAMIKVLRRPEHAATYEAVRQDQRARSAAANGVATPPTLPEFAEENEGSTC